MIFIGIDPGKNGAYALICTTGDGKAYGYAVHPWDDAGFAEWCRAFDKSKHERIMAAVEKVGAMPHQGVTSMFNFGKSAGYIEGVLAACDIPYQLVPPRTWKKSFGLGSSKEDSVTVCKRLFPKINLLPTPRCRKESDGMAEAMLISEYARRNL